MNQTTKKLRNITFENFLQLNGISFTKPTAGHYIIENNIDSLLIFPTNVKYLDHSTRTYYQLGSFEELKELVLSKFKPIEEAA